DLLPDHDAAANGARPPLQRRRPTRRRIKLLYGGDTKIIFGHGGTFDLGIILSQRWRMKVVRFTRLRPRPSCPAYAQGGALCIRKAVVRYFKCRRPPAEG